MITDDRSTTQVIGNTIGYSETYETPYNEYLQRITIDYGRYVSALTFYTDQGKKYGPYGGSGSSPNYSRIIELPSVRSRFVGVYGGSGSLIDNLGTAYATADCVQLWLIIKTNPSHFSHFSASIFLSTIQLTNTEEMSTFGRVFCPAKKCKLTQVNGLSQWGCLTNFNIFSPSSSYLWLQGGCSSIMWIGSNHENIGFGHTGKSFKGWQAIAR